MELKERPHATTLRHQLHQAEAELPELYEEINIYGTLAMTQTKRMLQDPSRITVRNLNTTKQAFDNAYKEFFGTVERCEILRKQIREVEGE